MRVIKSLSALFLSLVLSACGSVSSFDVSEPLVEDVGVESDPGDDADAQAGADTSPRDGLRDSLQTSSESSTDSEAPQSDSASLEDSSPDIDAHEVCSRYCINVGPTGSYRSIGEPCLLAMDCCSAQCGSDGRCVPPEGACPGCWCGGRMEWCPGVAGERCAP